MGDLSLFIYNFRAYQTQDHRPETFSQSNC